MIEDIDNISWDRLYANITGPQTLPALLKELFAARPPTTQLIDTIGDAVYCQGNFFSATPFVLPFLLKILEESPTDIKIHILSLLTILMRDCKDDVITTKKGKRYELGLHIYTEICEGIPQYLSFLGDEDVTIRLLSSFLLGFVDEDSFEIVRSLKARLEKESDPHAQHVIIRSIADLRGYACEELEMVLYATHTPLAQYALALSLARCPGRHAASQVENILVESLIHSEKYEEVYQLVPYETDVITDTCNALAHYGHPAGVRLLIKAIDLSNPHKSDMEILQLIDTLLTMAGFNRNAKYTWSEAGESPLYKFDFGITEATMPQIASVFLPEQQQALQCLLRCEPFWRIRTNLLQAYGLPAEKEEFYQLLAAHEKQRGDFSR